MIWRGYMDFVYGTCARTNHKWPIEDMSWDNGLLVRNESKDTSIDGALEYNWALEAKKDTHELQPDPKLIHPVDPRSQINTLPATSGTYGGY
jgi:hypothetical protein